MRNLHQRLCGVALAALVAWPAAGCGDASPASMTGKVTYNGMPVLRGVISVTPTDGSGKAEGAKIENGLYEIKSIEPGLKAVSILGFAGPEVLAKRVYSGREDYEAAAPERAAAAKQEVEIPVDAAGNGQQITVQPGPQTIDVALGKAP
jgi:hypothetical protein